LNVIDEHSHLALVGLLSSLLLTVWLAHRIGARAHAPGKAALATEASSSLLALLSLLLAFSVSLSVSRFEARRQLVIEEANAIGTAALRTRLLPEPFAAQSAVIFREYAAGRARWGEAPRGSGVEGEIERADAALHRELWARAITAAEVRRDPQHALYVASLNDVIDTQAERVHARNNRVPETVLYLLASVGLLALAVASYIAARNGAPGARGFHVLAGAIWLVIALIIDLDQPRRGWITISQEPLHAVAASLGERPR
jgi:hypothetical protein